MLIGELACLTRLTSDTLRFYEKEGLIEAIHFKRLSNGYKDYHETVLARLDLIQLAKKLGFPLARIKTLIVRWETGLISPAEKMQLLEDNMRKIDVMIAELEDNKSFLREKIAMLKASRRSPIQASRST